LATNPYFAEMAERHQIPFEPLGTESQFRESIQHPDLWHPRRSFGYLFAMLELVRLQQFELFARYARQGPFVGVVNCLSFGAMTAAEKFGFPCITAHCQPAVLWSDVKPPKLPGLFGPRWLRSGIVRLGERWFVEPAALPVLNHWRAELGLAPIQRLTTWWNSRDGVLGMFPEWYAPAQSDWPSPLKQTDFPLWNFRSDQSLEDEIAEFLSEGMPPIVFAPGSANVQAREFFAAAVHACQRLGRRGILLTEFDEQVPRILPASVARFSYAPLDLVLPHCSALVHHGGIGTASQAMLAGIPQLIMPMAHDQFDNAERITQLGIGSSISFRSFRGPRIARKLNALLTNPGVLQRCKQIADRLTRRDGLQRSAVAIEQLAHMSATDVSD
jgi:UDP:flavonoid glycosyltransferase YjiC (YdhE family)